MKKVPKNIFIISLGAVIILGIFTVGFFLGSSLDPFSEGSVNAEERVDLSTFWSVWDLIEEKYVPASEEDTASNEEKIYGAVIGLVDSLDDPYSVFLPPVETEQFNESIQGNFSGVGMEVGLRDGAITVISPLKNTPAERAGVKSGDIVIQIDDKSTTGMTLDDAVGLIRGEDGTTVKLILLREGVDEPVSVEIVRAKIKLPVLETELRGDGIFVISLFNFNAQSSSEFRAALREFILSRSNKLILDLRGNPGGFLDSSIDISSWFLPAGKVVVKESFGDNDSEEKMIRSKGYNIFNDNLEMVILVDAGSASASEIVAGALQEHGVATLVGTKTFGKGSVQELIQLNDDTSLKITIAQWLTPGGKSISDGGLNPDIEVEVTAEDIEEGRDLQLEKAVEILNN